MIDTARPWIESFDAIIAAPAPTAAPAGLGSTGNPGCATMATFLGIPAITIPIGLASNGLPLGMQLIGSTGADDALLAVAAWCEATLPAAPSLLDRAARSTASAR
jgi:amidase